MPIGRSRPPHAPRPQARHRRRSARPLMLRPARIAAVLAAVVVLTAVGGVSHLSSNVSTAPLRAEPTGSSAVEQGDDLDILLLGSDSRDLEDASFGAADGSRRRRRSAPSRVRVPAPRPETRRAPLPGPRSVW